MWIGSYLVVSGLWILVTTAMALLVTRVYLNTFFAATFGKIKKASTFRSKEQKSSLPFVSVVLPVYNEASVIGRLLNVVTKIDYPNYEVIVADDSTDKAMARHLKVWKRKIKVKVVHRNERRGFKAGAINNALQYANKKCKYVLIFDADYMPRKEIIWQMLADFSSSDIAAVQGYTQHTLNAPKNFLTKSSSLAFSSFSLVDVAVRKRLNGFVPVFGSVFMITKDSLTRIGGFDESSITEDWELASRLTLKGYKVFYDEGIVVPAECPSTFNVLLRQQMRWAEGITRDTKKHLFEMLKSKKVSLMKKFDYLFYGFSSLNGITGSAAYVLTFFMFLVTWRLIPILGLEPGVVLGLGGFGQFLLYVAPVYIPLALILSATLALYRESRLAESHWCVYLFFVSLALAPFVAFGGLKGLLSKRGSWTRTLKTGEVYKRAVSAAS